MNGARRNHTCHIADNLPIRIAQVDTCGRTRLLTCQRHLDSGVEAQAQVLDRQVLLKMVGKQRQGVGGQGGTSPIVRVRALTNLIGTHLRLCGGI